jgi:hypothetical protein
LLIKYLKLGIGKTYREFCFKKSFFKSYKNKEVNLEIFKINRIKIRSGTEIFFIKKNNIFKVRLLWLKNKNTFLVSLNVYLLLRVR